MSAIHTGYTYRVPLTVYSQVAAATAIRCQVAIDAEWRLFWDNIDSNGYGVRFEDGAGNNLLFNRTSWKPGGAETAEYNVQLTTPTGSSTTTNCVIYMVFVHATPTDSSVADTADPQKTVAIPVGASRPGAALVEGTSYDDPELVQMSLGASDIAVLLLGQALVLRREGQERNNSREYEAVRWFSVDVQNNAGADQATWYDLSKQEFRQSSAYGYGVYCHLAPQTAASNRVRVRLGTSLGRILVRWFEIEGVDPQV